PIEFSTMYQDLGFDSPRHVREVIRSQRPDWRMRYTSSGVPVLLRAGVVYDEKHKVPYYVAIGRNQAQSQNVLRNFTWHQIALLPLMVIAGCIFGWLHAGHSLRPVLAVAQTAQRITGSNLSLRIPSRGAGDELDYLILT